MTAQESFQGQLENLTQGDLPGVKRVAQLVGTYLDIFDPTEPVAVWATYPNVFTEAEDGSMGFDEGGAVLFVKDDTSVRVMPPEELFRRLDGQGSEQFRSEIATVKAMGSKAVEVLVVIEARKDIGELRNRVCVYGFGRQMAEA